MVSNLQTWQSKKGKNKMRSKLLTHYQLAKIVENRKPVSDIMRKRIAAKILSDINLLSDKEYAEQNASVLTNHEITILQNANRVRRLSLKY
jgi:hypothetical protein